MSTEPRIDVKPATNGNGNGHSAANGRSSTNGNAHMNGHRSPAAPVMEIPPATPRVEDDNFFDQSGNDILLEIDDTKGPFKRF
jgi:hypothetical protein